MEKLKTHEEVYEGEIRDAYPSKGEMFEKINEIVDWINVKMGLDNLERELKDKPTVKK